VKIDDRVIPSARPGPGQPEKLSDAELVCLAVAQVLLGARLKVLADALGGQDGRQKSPGRLGPADARFLMLTAITHHRFNSPIWGGREIRTLNAELAEREVLAAQVVNDHCATRSRPPKWLWDS